MEVFAQNCQERQEALLWSNKSPADPVNVFKGDIQKELNQPKQMDRLQQCSVGLEDVKTPRSMALD